MAEKKMNWKAAEAALNKRIADLALHPSGSSSMIIGMKLRPLRDRFDAGERSEELYDRIMREAAL